MNINEHTRHSIDADISEESRDVLTSYKSAMREIIVSGAYDTPESSIVLPSDIELRQRVWDAVQWAQRDSLRYVIVIGIGGSNLGTEAIYKALGSKNEVELLFLDTTSEQNMKDCIEKLDTEVTEKDEILVNIISKSGATTETVANFEILYEYLTKRFGNIVDRVVATTDGDSQLWVTAQKNGFYALDIPHMVGGRYSVFSAVGLFPLTLLNLSIDELLRGAYETRDASLAENGSMATELAAETYLLFQEGYTTHNTFVFDERLESLGKWWRQLVGESLGKNKSISGENTTAGIIPIVSVGSTDLHSVGQLYLSATRKIATTFIHVVSTEEYHVPGDSLTSFGSNLAGKSLSDIKNAIYQGTVTAYRDKELPFSEIILDSISEYEIGAYMQLKMLEIMILANLFGIDAFDQPNVEDYKKVTRGLLK